MQWPGPDAVLVEGHKQAESGNVMLWSTAQLQTAAQRDRHQGIYGCMLCMDKLPTDIQDYQCRNFWIMQLHVLSQHSAGC